MAVSEPGKPVLTTVKLSCFVVIASGGLNTFGKKSWLCGRNVDQTGFNNKTLCSYIILHFSRCRKTMYRLIAIASRMQFWTHQSLVPAEFDQSLMALKTLK